MTSSSSSSSPTTLALWRRLWVSYTARYKHILIISIVFMVLYAGSKAFLAALLKPVIDDIFTNAKADALFPICLSIFITFIVKGIAAYGETVSMGYMGQRIITLIQQDLFGHLIRADLQTFHKTNTGKLISHATNDVTLMRGAVSNTLSGAGKELLTLLGLVGVMFWSDWFLATMAFIAFPLSAIVMVRIGKGMRKITKKTQNEMGDLVSFLSECFQNVRLIKASTTEPLEIERAEKITNTLFKLSFKSIRLRALSSPLMETLGGIAVVIVIGYGGWRVIEGAQTAGEFFAFIAALLQAYEPVKRLSGLNANLQEGMAAATRIFDLIDTPITIREAPNAQPLVLQKGHILFDNVSFKYESGHQVFSNLTLEIPAGKTVALVGKSGAGKSTLLNLLPRFYDIQEGAIRIDGQDIRDVTLPSLRFPMALVSQEITLFHDTVRYNIAYGLPNVTQAEIEEAARAAAAHEFIQELEHGYDTVVGEHGVRLSGGQRQRVAIARALLRNAPILLLDEATSALDTHSERDIQTALHTLFRNRTNVVVAHRLSTIQEADLIYVLDKGRILESGTHHSLLAKNGAYAALYHLQFQQDRLS